MSPEALSRLIGTVTAATTDPTRQPASSPAVPTAPAALEQLGLNDRVQIALLVYRAGLL
ncbi:hypothetical protein [Streptomyces sp. NPDC088748]|uniref:hypothetical protein n=1 Tax=Streptomyces sp. NPDC088748 TaxID=3365887 RepID=UPI0038299AE0